MTTLSIQLNEDLAAAVRDFAELPEEEQRKYVRRIHRLKLAALKVAIQEGMDSPDEGDPDMEEIIREARAEWHADQES